MTNTSLDTHGNLICDYETSNVNVIFLDLQTERNVAVELLLLFVYQLPLKVPRPTARNKLRPWPELMSAGGKEKRPCNIHGKQCV